MAGSTDRKIYARNEILWFPVGADDTSTGDDTLNAETNVMNAAAAGLQRSIEALEQRFKDLGFDATDEDYSHILKPLFGFHGQDAVFNKYSDQLPIIWKTANNDNAPNNTNKVTKIGLDLTSNKLGIIMNGRPVFATGSPIMVTEVATSGGFSISNESITGPNSPFWGYVVAKPTVSGTLTLKAYFQNTWLDETTLTSVMDTGDVPLFTFKWGEVSYDTNYFWGTKGYTGSQTADYFQIYVNDFRDWRHPERTHPQLFAPRGEVRMFRPYSWKEVDLFFELVNTKYQGRSGMMWEGWRILDGFGTLPDMTERFPRGWDASDVDGSLIHTSGGGDTDATTVPSATQQVASGSGVTVANDTHTHTADIVPKFHTFFYLIKC